MPSEESTHVDWLNFNAERPNRDAEYLTWCQVRGYDPEDTDSMRVYEVETVRSMNEERAGQWMQDPRYATW